MGVSNAPGGVVDANRLLLFKVGVGLLSAGGGPSGGVGRHGAGDVAGACRLSLSGVSWPRFSWGVWLKGWLLLTFHDGPDPKGGELFSFVLVHL